MMKQAFPIFAVLAILLLAGCGQQATDSPDSGVAASKAADTNKIRIKDFSFIPSETIVDVGTTVTWMNEDSAPHTIDASGEFKSETLNNGESYSFTFTKTGDYVYRCGIHPSMKGKVKVK